MMFARSLQGHDKGTLYLVIEKSDCQVVLADGKYHTLEKPKKKNPKHVQLVKDVPDEVIAEKDKFEKLTNERVAFLIKKYKAVRNLSTTEEE